ncbi:MAG TPA: DUF3617 family protein [Gemmatimonadales bacterium]|jgi:hypothetical protein|nr:DUF3617 family protein [Gemmatimonadales bacterium]
MTSGTWYHLAATVGIFTLTATPAGATLNAAAPERFVNERELTAIAMGWLESQSCAVALVPVPAPSDEAAPAKEPGEKWEVTTQMTMEGMPMAMPPHTSTVCSPKEWTQPPAGDQGQKCTYTDFHMEGNKATWKVSCAGPPAMTGDGEITRDADGSFKGAMNFTSEGNKITIKMNGKKVGTCEI